MAEKVIRRQFRGCLKEDTKGRERGCTWRQRRLRKEVRRLIQGGRLLTASVYYHGNMCFPILWKHWRKGVSGGLFEAAGSLSGALA